MRYSVRLGSICMYSNSPHSATLTAVKGTLRAEISRITTCAFFAPSSIAPSCRPTRKLLNTDFLLRSKGAEGLASFDQHAG